MFELRKIRQEYILLCMEVSILSLRTSWKGNIIYVCLLICLSAPEDRGFQQRKRRLGFQENLKIRLTEVRIIED